tara:strand:- start:896 stop:1609 length:714 start_codon:yes stop_codon:yes gene_type:complete
MRNFNRKNDELRKISIQTDINKFSEGSCKIAFGNTEIICTASVESNLPRWLQGSSSGWITAEYNMLPRSTPKRSSREAKVGKQSGRTMEIQRLIGRSLRSIIDLKRLKGFQIVLDCDVIQADGGTRTTSITGAYIALNHALKKMVQDKDIKLNPIKDKLCAVSCGIVKDETMLDLDYEEDFSAMVDANFVFSQNSGIVEIQASGEECTFTKQQFDEMYKLALKGADKIFKTQEGFLK